MRVFFSRFLRGFSARATRFRGKIAVSPSGARGKSRLALTMLKEVQIELTLPMFGIYSARSNPKNEQNYEETSE